MFVSTRTREEDPAETARKQQEKAEALEKARLIMQDLYGDSKEEKKELQQTHDIPALYSIEETLQNPAPATYVPEVWVELHPKLLEDTPEGKYWLTRRLAIMKQSVPDDVEVNIRINPKSGKAEIFARGESLDYDQYQRKKEQIMDNEITLTSQAPPMANDYKNAKCSISPIDQKALIKNTKSALEIVNKMGTGYESYVDISKYVAQEMGLPTSEKTKQASTIEDARDTLHKAGLQNATNDYAIQTTGATSKESQPSIKR